MSKLTDALNAIDIHNTHGLLFRFGVPKVDDVAVSYSASSMRGAVQQTSVWSCSHETDPNERLRHMNQNNKTFIGPSRESFPAAKQWATERYRIRDWVSSPFGAGELVSQAVVLRARQFLEKTGTDALSEEARKRLFKALRYEVANRRHRGRK